METSQSRATYDENLTYWNVIIILCVLFACSQSKLRLAAQRGGVEAGKAASEKLKERVGEGGGDALSNPKQSHNLDLSTLKPLPKERGVGSGVKNPESQGIQGTAKPGEQEEAEEIDFPLRVFPSATWVGPFSRKSIKRPKRD